MFDLSDKNVVENRSKSYFKRRASDSDEPAAAKKKNPNPEIIASATEHVNWAEIKMVMDEVEKSTAR